MRFERFGQDGAKNSSNCARFRAKPHWGAPTLPSDRAAKCNVSTRLGFFCCLLLPFRDSSQCMNDANYVT
jgi:hypothetical protein